MLLLTSIDSFLHLLSKTEKEIEIFLLEMWNAEEKVDDLLIFEFM